MEHKKTKKNPDIDAFVLLRSLSTTKICAIAQVAFTALKARSLRP